MDLKKTKKILTALLVLILLLILLGSWSKLLYIPAAILTGVYIAVYWKNWRCPYCKGLLGRGVGTRCPHCGKDAGITMFF